MAITKDNGTSLFPALSDFFETDRWIAPDKIFRGFQNSLPAANISETDKEYKIELVTPGFKKDEIKVNLEQETLTISAENKTEKEETNKSHSQRVSYGTFTRSFLLPKAANGEKIATKCRDRFIKTYHS